MRHLYSHSCQNLSVILFRVGRSISAPKHCDMHLGNIQSDTFVYAWMLISHAAFFLIFQNCQKLVLRTKNEITKMADIVNRHEATQSAFLNLLGILWMTLWYSFYIILVKKQNEIIKMADIVNRREASQSAFLNLLGILWMTLWYSFCIILVKKQSKFSDIVLFCINPLKMKSYFLFLIDM